SLLALATSVVPFLGLWVLMYLALQVSYLLVLALAVPTAGFLVRTYILFHDCAHGSFLRGRRANAWLGAVLAVLVFAALGGWRDLLLIHMPLISLAGGTGIWLFYVQHQFADTYWERSREWSYADAALRGSSYLRLPKVLQFFTGNIGLHHVHHLNPKIPNYSLQRAHDENPIFHTVPTISLWDGLRAVRLKLWDEDSARLVTWA